MASTTAAARARRKVCCCNTDITIDATITVTIDLTNVNEAPTITSGPTTMNVAESSTAVGSYAASDVDDPDTQTWSVESADDGRFFQINSSGELSFISAPDFEDKQDAGEDNVYDVTVKVTDSGSPAMNATRDVAVTVTNVNEAPTITIGLIVLDYSENQPTSTLIDLYVASDPDASTTFTWSLEGADESVFRITTNAAGQGVVRFRSSPNFEMATDIGGDNDYNFTVKVEDNGNPVMSAMQDVTVSVKDINERPEVSGSSTATFAEIEFDADDADLTPADFEILHGV